MNARAAITQFKDLIDTYSEEPLTGELVEAARLMDAALMLLKRNGQTISESEQFKREHDESYYGVRKGSQEDLFEKRVSSSPNR